MVDVEATVRDDSAHAVRLPDAREVGLVVPEPAVRGHLLYLVLLELEVVVEVLRREVVAAEPTQVRGQRLGRNAPAEPRVQVLVHRLRVLTGGAAGRRQRRALRSVLHGGLVARVHLLGDVLRRLTEIRRGEHDEHRQRQRDHEAGDGDELHQPRGRGTQLVDVVTGFRQADSGEDRDEHHPEPDVAEEVAGHLADEVRQRVEAERHAGERERRRHGPAIAVELLRDQVRHHDGAGDERVERRHQEQLGEQLADAEADRLRGVHALGHDLCALLGSEHPPVQRGEQVRRHVEHRFVLEVPQREDRQEKQQLTVRRRRVRQRRVREEPPAESLDHRDRGQHDENVERGLRVVEDDRDRRHGEPEVRRGEPTGDRLVHAAVGDVFDHDVEEYRRQERRHRERVEVRVEADVVQREEHQRRDGRDGDRPPARQYRAHAEDDEDDVEDQRGERDEEHRPLQRDPRERAQEHAEAVRSGVHLREEAHLTGREPSDQAEVPEAVSEAVEEVPSDERERRDGQHREPGQDESPGPLRPRRGQHQRDDADEHRGGDAEPEEERRALIDRHLVGGGRIRLRDGHRRRKADRPDHQRYRHRGPVRFGRGERVRHQRASVPRGTGSRPVAVAVGPVGAGSTESESESVRSGVTAGRSEPTQRVRFRYELLMVGSAGLSPI